MSELTDVQERVVDVSVHVYQARGERAALRCGLSDAAALCDFLAGLIKTENRGRNGKGAVTKRGMELAQIATRCGDAIYEMRELVLVPESSS